MKSCSLCKNVNPRGLYSVVTLTERKRFWLSSDSFSHSLLFDKRPVNKDTVVFFFCPRSLYSLSSHPAVSLSCICCIHVCAHYLQTPADMIDSSGLWLTGVGGFSGIADVDWFGIRACRSFLTTHTNTLTCEHLNDFYCYLMKLISISIVTTKTHFL